MTRSPIRIQVQIKRIVAQYHVSPCTTLTTTKGTTTIKSSTIGGRRNLSSTSTVGRVASTTKGNDTLHNNNKSITDTILLSSMVVTAAATIVAVGSLHADNKENKYMNGLQNHNPPKKHHNKTSSTSRLRESSPCYLYGYPIFPPLSTISNLYDGNGKIHTPLWSIPSPIPPPTRTLAEPHRKNTPVKHSHRHSLNVMLTRMRSVSGRGLNEKYKVDWNTVLGEGAFGAVHPARLALTGEKVRHLP
jgi:hypothetical protein